jgi:TPR repeat protein
LELFDCGTPYIPPPLSPEEIAAAKAAQEKADAEKKAAAAAQKQAAAARALKANQDAAAKGDMFGQLRMGERYRDGDGVEKDLAKAKEYLQKAADAGSPTAKDELSKLNQP